MNNDTQVYCTNCIHGNNLIKSLIEDDERIMSDECITCHPFDCEDSRPFSLRKNYIEKIDMK